MVFRRKYKFNWLDHLYYMGKHTIGFGFWGLVSLDVRVFYASAYPVDTLRDLLFI